VKIELGSISVGVLVIIFVWLILLSLFYYWMLRHYKRLIKGVKSGNLKKVLEKVIETEQKNKLDIKKIKEVIKDHEKENTYNLQKVGMVRFNPFKEMGGDQSFSLALLDDNESGVVVTGLHTRERTRIYIKTVKNGKSEYELSKEEAKAIKGAKKKKFKN
jgi:hypothetical protein